MQTKYNYNFSGSGVEKNDIFTSAILLFYFFCSFLAIWIAEKFARKSANPFKYGSFRLARLGFSSVFFPLFFAILRTKFASGKGYEYYSGCLIGFQIFPFIFLYFVFTNQLLKMGFSRIFARFSVEKAFKNGDFRGKKCAIFSLKRSVFPEIFAKTARKNGAAPLFFSPPTVENSRFFGRFSRENDEKTAEKGAKNGNFGRRTPENRQKLLENGQNCTENGPKTHFFGVFRRFPAENASISLVFLPVGAFFAFGAENSAFFKEILRILEVFLAFF
eukprot:TRINITY_DN3395_c0_g3_i4.p1 TRINITY_DN3395_c0_g3~~TRINITY_DN3395_c0_g3_i4.p1  ORF type:complete len:308 (-),score=116.50 TRINITY_DN3395_c0_g3_i4:1133-1957(-)